MKPSTLERKTLTIRNLMFRIVLVAASAGFAGDLRAQALFTSTVNLPGPVTDGQAAGSGDFNKDGKLDFVVGTGGNAPDIVYMNLGGGQWSRVDLPLNTTATDLKVGDFDSDTRLDIFVATSNAKDVIYWNNANGVWTATELGTFTTDSRACAIGFLDNNTRLDIAVATGGTQDHYWYRNNGSRQFDAVAFVGSTSVTKNGRGAAIGDFNADGKQDVFFASANGIDEFFLQNASGFTRVGGPGGNLSTVAFACVAGDFDGLPTNGQNVITGSNGSFDIRLSSTTMTIMGQQQTAYTYTAVNVASPTTAARENLVAADFNGDGKLDIAAVAFNANDFLYINNNSNPQLMSFMMGESLAGTVASRALATGDFDADGDIDLLVATTGAQDFIYVNNFYSPVDTDGDGVPDGDDPNPTNEFVCGDSDNDGCDDCSSLGYLAPANDGPDNDGDGLCDLGDTDDDNDGIPDEWEVVNGTNALVSDGHLDDDGDDVTNYNEYVSGSNPQDQLSVGQTLSSFIQSGQWKLRFTAKKAEGPGYTGKNRYFTVVKSDILGSPGVWVPVTGYVGILGNNQDVIVSGLSSTGSSPHIYRLEIDLR